MFFDHAVIIQARNEEKFISTCIQSVLDQHVMADKILVVNDGSVDKTSNIIKKYKIEELYFNVPRIKQRGINQAYCFNKSVEHLIKKGFNLKYIVKVDADTKLPKDYTHRLILQMMYDDKLGIVSGMPTNERIRGDRVSDTGRIIRMKCWKEINGYDLVTGFDSLAIWKAINKGWLVKSFNRPRYTELRSSNKATLSRWYYAGQLRKMSSMPFYYTFLGAMKNIKKGSPPIIGSIAMMLSHLITTSRFEQLDESIIRHHAINEVRNFLRKDRFKKWFE